MVNSDKQERSRIVQLKDRPNRSKGKGLKYDKLEMQTYLWSDKLSLKEAKLLFKIRTRMLDVKTNFKNKYIRKNTPEYDNLLCEICKTHIDNTKKTFSNALS